MNIAEMAAIARRYDTRVAKAMLKACGVNTAPRRRGRRGRGRRRRRGGRYRGMRDCFENREHVRPGAGD